MQYKKLVAYFENDETLTDLLNFLAENYFNVIDDLQDQYSNDIISTSDELIKTKKTLQGIIASLEPIYSKALSLKKQKEYRYYVEKKGKCEEEGKKFTDSSTTTESKDAVRLYRDARDIIKGYLNSASGLYFDIKDTLDRMKAEYIKTKDND